MNITLDAEKAFEKNSTHLYDKCLGETRIQGSYLNIIKAIYSKPTTNIKLHGENLKPFHQNQKQDKAFHFLHTSSI